MFYYFSIFILLLAFQTAAIFAQVNKTEAETKSSDSQTSSPDSINISPNAEPIESIKEDDLIHFGDLLDVDILGSTEYDWRGVITREGFLSGLEFSENEIYGLCRTEKSVALDIAESYSKILKNPQVEVTILDRSNRPVSTLYGAVKLPHRFKLQRQVRLSELIVLAGGFTEKASGTIQILRQPDTSCITKKQRDFESANPSGNEFVKVSQNNGAEFINIKISDLLSGDDKANPQILYGDIVTILTAQPIYIIGGVVKPSKIAEREKLTVSRAIDSAGGLTKQANPQNVTIFRKENGETKLIKIDLDKISAKKAEDVILKAYDIVDVAEKGRDVKKYPPIIEFDDPENKNNSTLPLRVID